MFIEVPPELFRHAIGNAERANGRAHRPNHLHSADKQEVQRGGGIVNNDARRDILRTPVALPFRARVPAAQGAS